MIAVENIPDEIHEVLTTFSDWFFEQDRSGFKVDQGSITSQEAVSIEYLHQQQQKKQSGFPTCANGIDFQHLHGFDLDKFYPAITEADFNIKTFLGAENCALKMYYPAGGYIDWHTNANAFGYNTLFTYSKEGDGAFLYQNPLTKEIITIPDKKGWNMKIGIYDVHGGSPLWHSAYTNCERLTWAYILNQVGWNNLIEELQVDITPLVDMFGGQLPSYKKPRILAMDH